MGWRTAPNTRASNRVHAPRDSSPKVSRLRDQLDACVTAEDRTSEVRRQNAAHLALIETGRNKPQENIAQENEHRSLPLSHFPEPP